MSRVEPFPTAAVEAIGRASHVEVTTLVLEVQRLRFLRKPSHEPVEMAAWIGAIRMAGATDDDQAVRVYGNILAAYTWRHRVGEPELPSIDVFGDPHVREVFEQLLAIGKEAQK